MERNNSEPQPIGRSMRAIQESILSRAPVAGPVSPKAPPASDPWDSVVKPTSPYHRCTLDNYEATTDEQKRVLEGTREYASDIHARRKQPTGAMWFGSVGTGKDHLALGVLRIAKAAKYSCKVVFGEQFRSQTREVIMSDDQSEEKFLRQFHQDFLLLSDPIPVRGELTPTQSDALMSVMRSRIELGLPTLVTVNVLNRYDLAGNIISRSRQEAEDRMGLPTYDRMAMGSYVFECQWKSHRKPERFFK